ncbi:MAG: GWxTD domain-containing protein [Bryobacterales bacterium]|nr:GWxTD domain-containing protein [Bryobacterales bacterium]
MTAIAAALFQSAWQGAAIAASLFFLLRLVPHNRPQTRYLAACAALAAMLCGFLFALLDAGGQRDAGDVIAAPAATWPAWLWLAGVASIACRRTAGWLLLRHRVRHSTAPALAVWLNSLFSVRCKFHNLRGVSVLRADWLGSPAVYGVLKPVILIPAAAVAKLTPQQLEAILAHELAHIVRHDYLWNLLQTAAETLLFHHPAAWWIARQIRQERECCCDRMAAEATGSRNALAHALLAMEEQRATMPAPAANGGDLRARMERLMGVHRAPRVSNHVLTAVVCLAAAAHSIAFQDIPAGPYGKWLTEDVLYIIQPEERKAFLGLRSDEEREHFIGQFWTRRDPTPATMENEAKEEHYRRIAYANERFKATLTPGWKTDRGKMYILAGPPDEILSWPAQLLERWIYKPKNSKEEKYEFRDGKIQPMPK